MEYKRKAREVGDSYSSMSRSQLLRYRTLRALGFLTFIILGFRFAPPQALCFHPLCGFVKGKPALTCSELSFSLSFFAARSIRRRNDNLKFGWTLYFR
jgi:hypothetical protein